MTSRLIMGNSHTDDRGTLIYNNNFDASQVKRIYFIENRDLQFVRAWQGHQIEQRWFTAVGGSFLIKIIAIDNWEKPTSTLLQEEYILTSENLEVLHVPAGFVSSIQALDENSKLMLMADYRLGEIQDEFRFEGGYFEGEKRSGK